MIYYSFLHCFLKFMISDIKTFIKTVKKIDTMIPKNMYPSNGIEACEKSFPPCLKMIKTSVITIMWTMKTLILKLFSCLTKYL